jgi:hypothetical protein
LRRALVVTLVLAVLVPGVALGRGDASPAYLITRVTLTGKAETPRGDRDGSGTVTLCVETKSRSLAYRFATLRRIGPPTAGHIHLGAPGTAGVVVVPFAAPSKLWAGTVSVTSTLLTSLLRHPARYYVNVHTKAYPNGAIRGQLGRWTRPRVRDIATVCGF